MLETLPTYEVSPPANWSSRVIEIFAAPGPTPASGVGPNIVLMREALPSGDPAARPKQLMAYAEEQIRSMTPQLRDPSFDPLERLVYRNTSVLRVNVVWSSGATRVRQWIVFFPLGKDHVLVATATAAEAEFKDYASGFAETLGSIVLPA